MMPICVLFDLSTNIYMYIYISLLYVGRTDVGGGVGYMKTMLRVYAVRDTTF